MRDVLALVGIGGLRGEALEAFAKSIGRIAIERVAALSRQINAQTDAVLSNTTTTTTQIAAPGGFQSRY